MSHNNYNVISFDRETATMVIKFDEMEAYNFNAPFLDGEYLSGAALDSAIRQLCPYSSDELDEMRKTLTGGGDIDALVAARFIA